MITLKNQNHIKNKTQQLTTQSGVYLMKDEFGNIIYIGKAKNLRNRVSTYFNNTKKQDKVQRMVENVFDFEYIITNSEIDALNLESNLIKQHQPFYNINLKFGNNHPFLRIDFKGKLPTISIVRKIKQDQAKYFGPFFGGVTLREIMLVLENAFFIEDDIVEGEKSSPYKRTSLNIFLGKIKPNKSMVIDKEKYLQEVARVINFLNGDLEEAKAIITQKMQKFSQMESFEMAIKFRDSLKVIEKLKQQVITEFNKSVNIDVFGYSTNGQISVIAVLVVRGGKMVGVNNYLVVDSSLDDAEIINNFILQYYPTNSTIPSIIASGYKLDDALDEWLNTKTTTKVSVIQPMRGIRRELLAMANKNAEEYLEKNIEKSKKEWMKTVGAVKLLQQHFSLKQEPIRIEGYDISNNQGENIVASMVVFVNGVSKKSHYRRFKIQNVQGQNNDFLSMAEAFERRVKNFASDDISFSAVPNLILVDGGKGQLKIIKDIIDKYNLNIEVLALAERIDEVFTTSSKTSVYLNRTDNALRLLQAVRDESHRFANEYHNKLGMKKATQSQLAAITGVGNATIKKLLSHFKSINKIKTATEKQLLEVKGITKSQANNIYNHFNNSKT